MKEHIFISYCDADEAFVIDLRKRLELLDLKIWVKPRELTAGSKHNEAIKKAMEEAWAVIVVLSRKTQNVPHVLKETKQAVKIQKQKRRSIPDDDTIYRVIPLMLEGIKPPALIHYFGTGWKGIEVNTAPGGLDEAMQQILPALGLRKPDHLELMISPEAAPLEDLILELSDPKMVEIDDIRRARAKAKLIYKREGNQREMESQGRFYFTAPMGPIEKDELSWYLERYHQWPWGEFNNRAARTAAKFPEWGNLLYNCVTSNDTVRDVLNAWESSEGPSIRRFTVFIDARSLVGASEEETHTAMEAATQLLGLPWELLHDGKGYLFQGAKPVRVRRQLPNTLSIKRAAVSLPLRVLLVSPRPEDETAGYIDHRSSALPLVTAMENLGDLTTLTILSPPTFPAMEEAMLKANKSGAPFHVVHFDGHGVYDKKRGLGGLCFEDPQEIKKTENRKSQIVHAADIAAVMRDHHIPLMFLDACRNAQTDEEPTASVASSLLDEGVSSVIAMSHSVLTKTSEMFTESFYRELVLGEPVGEAMLAGQRKLKGDSFRMKVFGAGKLHLQDWFVPVLYQEEQDLHLVKKVPGKIIKEINRDELEARMGALPKPPEHGFIGRCRELLKLERLLNRENVAVIRGQGGEGKTTLAVELARWLVRSERFERAVFVSVEHLYDLCAIVDGVGRQLVPKFSVAQLKDETWLDESIQLIQREMRNARVIVVLDNMETILPAEGIVPRFEPEMLEEFFKFCEQLLKITGTRLVFTSREPLPKPFGAGRQYVELRRLHRSDAVELIHRSMVEAGIMPKEEDTKEAQPEVEALVESVNCHARSLVLLAQYVGEFGVRQTTEKLGELMTRLHKKYSNDRELSLFASLELSLQRLEPKMRKKIKGLGVFQGGGRFSTLEHVLELTKVESIKLAVILVQIGLAELMPHDFLSFHPGLSPYLRFEMTEKEEVIALVRWVESMTQLLAFLDRKMFEDAQSAFSITALELPNLMELVEQINQQGDATATTYIAAFLEPLLSTIGRKDLLLRVVEIREEAAQGLAEWSNSLFIASVSKIERLLESRNLNPALSEAQILLQRCKQAGSQGYPGAAYDWAMAYELLGKVLYFGGAANDALTSTMEAQQRFQILAEQGNKSAARMVSLSLTQKGDCLTDLGRLEEAANAYEQGIKISGEMGDYRQSAVGKAQLGTVRLFQKRYSEALKAYKHALKTFSHLGEPETVARAWHQIGMTHQEAGQFEVAEEAYRKSLVINVQQYNPAGEATILLQLGSLFNKMKRLEEAVIFSRQAAEKFMESGNKKNEGTSRSNLAEILLKLNRPHEARTELLQAIKCIEPFGLAAAPWKTWNILCDLETAECNPDAAAHARSQAVQLFLAYRRDGGENHFTVGRLCFEFKQAMAENRVEEMKTILDDCLKDWKDVPQGKLLVIKLQAVLTGSRDLQLAEDPELTFDCAVELILLLEYLEEKENGKMEDEKIEGKRVGG